jgi:hypothetical protein
MSITRVEQVLLLLSVLMAAASSSARGADASPVPAAGGGSDRQLVPDGKDGTPPRLGLGYPYAAPLYPGYGPPPGGGWGYGRGYSGNPPGYGAYRRRGGGYRQHRQYANPPLFPVPRQRAEQSPSDRQPGTLTSPALPQAPAKLP